MRIKEGDEWKAAFLTPEGSFEPTVMFFGLTNSLAMFQAMMNDLLRDLVVEEKVAVFIDDVMIATCPVLCIPLLSTSSTPFYPP